MVSSNLDFLGSNVLYVSKGSSLTDVICLEGGEGVHEILTICDKGGRRNNKKCEKI